MAESRRTIIIRAAHVTQRSSPMAHVVFVHGIAQEQLSADSLEAEWIPALAGGVRNAGYPRVADRLRRDRSAGGIEARMAFYGDLFLRAGQMGAGGEELS